MSLSIFNPRNRFFEDEYSIIDPLFGALIHAKGSKDANSLIPLMTCDLIESKDDFHIHVDLPGVEAKDLDLAIEGRSLVIKAERNHVHETGTDKIHSMERSYGKVQRSIRLPQNVDLDKIDSKFKNGVLSIVVPKVAAPGPKKLKIQHE